MEKSTNGTYIDAYQFTESGTSSNTALSKKLGDNEDNEKKELKKKLKAHHKMLSEKADEHYEKDEKELGKKYRAMANKLAEDMDDETKELSLSSYEIDEAALSNPQLSEMQKLKDELDIKLSSMQQALMDSMTTQLSGIATQTAKLSHNQKIQQLEQELTELKSKAAQFSEGE